MDLQVGLGVHGDVLADMRFGVGVAVPTAEGAVIAVVNDEEATGGRA